MFRPTILFLTAALGIAWSQSADDVAHETQRLKALVDDERRAMATDSASQAEWRSQSKERLASMRSDSRKLARERDSLREALDRESRPKPPPPPPVAPATVRKKAFSEALANEIDKTMPLLSAELEGSTELREKWTALAKGLRAGNQDPDDAMGTFLDDLSERIDLGGRIQARPGSRTEPSGLVLRGTWIDVGGSLQVFSSKDGSAALRGPDGKTVDVVDKSVAADLARSAKVLSGEADPAWVDLPVRTEPRP
jgi:hypothetical protein